MATSPFTPEFDAVVEKTMKKWRIPGASFSVVHGEGTWAKGYGLAQQDPPIKVTDSTLWYAASTSKAQFCALWALYIASQTQEEDKTKSKESQKIKFATPLADIIREDFVLFDPSYTAAVSIEDAVSHRTGIPRYEVSYGFDGTKTVKDVTRNLRHLPMRTPLRTEHEYCNTMYAAATHALETVEGKALSAIFRDRLWDPLEMHDTYAGLPEAQVAIREKGAVLAKGSMWSKRFDDPDEAQGSYNETPHLDLSAISGAGYAISTPTDYAKWMRCLLFAKAPLSSEIIEDLWEPRIVTRKDKDDDITCDGALCYALGWYVHTYRGHRVLWHPGGVISAGSMVVLVPDLKWGVTYMGNGQNTGMALESLPYWLLDEVLGTPPDERVSDKIDQRSMRWCEKSVAEYNESRAKFYPDAPSKPQIPPSLPLDQYTGTYANEAYGRLTLTVGEDDEGQYLFWDVNDRAWVRSYKFRHVNAEWWFGEGRYDVSQSQDATRAETRIGADGKVQLIRIIMEEAMPDLFFDFKRITG